MKIIDLAPGMARRTRALKRLSIGVSYVDLRVAFVNW